MNLYFLFLSAYAVLITPISLHFRVRLGKQVSYSIRLQAAGLPFVGKKKADDKSDEKPLHEEDVAKSLAASDLAAVRALLSKRVRSRLLKVIRLYDVSVFVRFSFDDAALTALCFSATRTVLETLAFCGVPSGVVSGRVEADFRSQGSELVASGIVGARLGSLGLAAITFGKALMSARRQKQQPKEEAYAAPH